jgi:hypothetical protein
MTPLTPDAQTDAAPDELLAEIEGVLQDYMHPELSTANVIDRHHTTLKRARDRIVEQDRHISELSHLSQLVEQEEVGRLLEEIDRKLQQPDIGSGWLLTHCRDLIENQARELAATDWYRRSYELARKQHGENEDERGGFLERIADLQRQLSAAQVDADKWRKLLCTNSARLTEPGAIDKLIAERDAAQAKAEANEKDAERLAWIEMNTAIYRFLEDGSKQWFTGPWGIRAAVDAARSASGKNG